MKNIQIQPITIKSNKATGWQEINWKEVNIRIQDLQDKIVKATLKNNMKEVYRLQEEIVISFEGRALAIRRVVTSSGGKTPGVDNIIWDTPNARFKAIKQLGLITKNPNSYKKLTVKKSNDTQKQLNGITATWYTYPNG